MRTSALMSIPALLSSSTIRLAPSLNFGFAANLNICIVEGGDSGDMLISILVRRRIGRARMRYTAFA